MTDLSALTDPIVDEIRKILREYYVFTVGQRPVKMVGAEIPELSFGAGDGKDYKYDDSVLKKQTNGKPSTPKVVMGKLLYKNQTTLSISRTDDGSSEFALRLVVDAAVQHIPEGTPVVDVSKSRAIQSRVQYTSKKSSPNFDKELGKSSKYHFQDQILEQRVVDLALHKRGFAQQGILYFYGSATVLQTIDQLLAAPVESQRVVVTPSYERYCSVAGSAETYVLSQGSNSLWAHPTVHIILVRPFQRDEYVAKFCTRNYVVVTMPTDEESVGSARFWATIVGYVLHKDAIFMLDDSFCSTSVIKYRHGQINKKGKDENFPLEVGVSLLENVFTQLLPEERCVVGVISLRRHGQMPNTKVVIIDYCQAFLLVNLHATFQAGVFFRRNFFHAEDLLFCQTCLIHGLLTLVLSHVRYYDLNEGSKMIQGTGAHSPHQSGSARSFAVLVPCVKLSMCDDLEGDSPGYRAASPIVAESDQDDGSFLKGASLLPACTDRLTYRTDDDDITSTVERVVAGQVDVSDLTSFVDKLMIKDTTQEEKLPPAKSSK